MWLWLIRMSTQRHYIVADVDRSNLDISLWLLTAWQQLENRIFTVWQRVQMVLSLLEVVCGVVLAKARNSRVSHAFGNSFMETFFWSGTRIFQEASASNGWWFVELLWKALTEVVDPRPNAEQKWFQWMCGRISWKSCTSPGTNIIVIITNVMTIIITYITIWFCGRSQL